MANMETRIDQFIAEKGIDEEIKDSLIELVNGCFADYVSHMSKEWLSNPIKTVQTKEKTEKLKDPTEAEAIEDLRKCTSVILNEYCKTHELKIGGTKKDVMNRVWRHLQGETSDDDAGRKVKAKKVPTTKEQHSCFACNVKGAPCGSAATEQHAGEWFCYRHIDDAEDILSKNVSKEKIESTKNIKVVKPAKKAPTKSVEVEEELEEEE